jgi:tocopherol O-methyltransferase
MSVSAPDLKGAIRRHYDEMADLYRIFWGDHIHHGLFLTNHESPEAAQLNLLDHCAELIRLNPGSRVLDAGCGHGGTSLYLSRQFQCRVTGVTLSPRQAELARVAAASSAQASNVDFMVADLEELDLPPDAYDVVWVMESSEHFLDRQAFFRKAAGALKRNGIVLLAAWTGSPHDPLVAKVADIFLCPPLQQASDYCRHLEEAGLSVRRVQDLSSRVSQTWEVCRRRSQSSTLLLRLLPQEVRDFVSGMDVILRAYQTGVLHYSVITAQRG